jgi:hypothetical protein
LASDGIKGEFNAFTQQVADTLPILEQMGYEVSTFRVQWGLPPIDLACSQAFGQ